MDANTGEYSFQLDKQWFTLNADLLRKPLDITPVDSAHPFVSPPAGDQIMDFVNDLGYPEEIHFVSKMHVNNLYQPWRAILSLINRCLTGKTSGNDKPRHPIFQMLWDIVIRSNVNYAELLWEDNSKFKADKPAPVKKPAPAKQTKPVKEKSTKPAPSTKAIKAPEPQIEDDEYNLQRGIQMSLESFQAPVGGVAIREPTSCITRSLPVRQTPVTEEASIGPSAQPQDDTSANVVRDTSSPADAETGADTDDSNSEGDTKILNVDEERGENVSNTMALEERTFKLDEGQAGSDPGNTLESRPPADEDQVRANPGQSRVALAGPNPEPMHKDFVAIVYPQVNERLKHTTEERIHIKNPLSSSRTLSSMKNLDDAFTFSDQFLNDKPTEEATSKANVETKVESMVTVPIHQASSLAPLLSTPIIDLTHPKPVSPLAQQPAFVATTETTATTTTTTLLPPPPLQQQITTDPKLANRVSALEEICANLANKNKLQDQTTQALSSRIFTLENHDLYSKIDNYINETVKEAVQNALQAPVRERFRELSEFEMKEILRDRMFESGSYRSQPEHAALYEALEASMDRENREEFVKATTKSRKRRRDDQDPSLSPSKDSDQNKKKSHDSDTSASKQSQAQTSLV
ncbi:hypothetical protein Tco_0369506 [Tanacetum coccineum]